MKAARKVFGRTGIGHFRMIEIADAAGVGKGTLYEYFPSKNDLILGCFVDMMEDLGGFLNNRLSELQDPVCQIKTIIAATFEFYRTERDRIEALFDFYAMGIPRCDGKPALVEISPFYGEMIKQVGRIVQTGIDSGYFRPVNADLAASMILGLLDGLFFQIALRVISFDDDELQEEVGSIILGGLLPPKDK